MFLETRGYLIRLTIQLYFFDTVEIKDLAWDKPPTANAETKQSKSTEY